MTQGSESERATTLSPESKQRLANRARAPVGSALSWPTRDRLEIAAPSCGRAFHSAAVRNSGIDAITSAQAALHLTQFIFVF
jgi:hypothetical protein